MGRRAWLPLAVGSLPFVYRSELPLPGRDARATIMQNMIPYVQITVGLEKAVEQNEYTYYHWAILQWQRQINSYITLPIMLF